MEQMQDKNSVVPPTDHQAIPGSSEVPNSVTTGSTFPISSSVPPKQAAFHQEFFKNFVVESVDNTGRTSMRQIVKTEAEGRTSAIGLSNQHVSATSKQTGEMLKFIRKSELSQDFLTSKSIISIKGENQVEYKYGSAQHVVEALAEQMKFSINSNANQPVPNFDPADF